MSFIENVELKDEAELKLIQLITNLEYFKNINDRRPYDNDLITICSILHNLMTKPSEEIFKINPFYYKSEWL